MCSFKDNKVTTGIHVNTSAVAKINGRPVLQPTCNRVPNLNRRNSFKKLSPKSSPSPPPPPPLPGFKPKASLTATTTPPKSPESKSQRTQAIKRGSELNSSYEKVVTPRSNTKSLERKKSKSFKDGSLGSYGMIFSSASAEASLSYSSSLIVEAPGSIAAVRREQMGLQLAQRKMRVAHYGRSKSTKFENIKSIPIDNSSSIITKKTSDQEEKRCKFITPNSDPIYAAYHDEEWGVPVHDDNMLFELLVLSGAQVGSDWTSILKRRQHFRDAFSGFDAETVANFTNKQMMSISTEYNIEISRIRGVVENSNRILKVKKEFGAFEKYIWGFVNQKPISTGYKVGHKIPVKTSKSESISKDMVRRGFRFVGPTVVHSFMQAAGVTNDHLITCHRHLPCTLLAAEPACWKNRIC